MSAKTENTPERTEPEHEALMAEAYRLGRMFGSSAAHWYFDGNTTRETYERVLAQLVDGDPAVYDTFPAYPLSGEWAGSYDGNDLAESLEIEVWDDAMDAACAMFEDGYGVAFADEVERAARAMLEPDPDPDPEPEPEPESSYVGWTNYPTWVTNLWMANDEGSYRFWIYNSEQAIVVEAEDRADRVELPRSAATILAEQMREHVRRNTEPERATLGAYLIGYALDCVDWREIAAAWVHDVRENGLHMVDRSGT